MGLSTSRLGASPRQAVVPVVSGTVTPDELADVVGESLVPMGYSWGSGIVLTNLECSTAQEIMETNRDFGVLVPELGAWVSLCNVTGGLVLPEEAVIEPERDPGPWAVMYGLTNHWLSVAVFADEAGTIVYAAATDREAQAARLLAVAAARTVEDSDVLPPSLESALVDPPGKWVDGWQLHRRDVLGV